MGSTLMGESLRARFLPLLFVSTVGVVMRKLDSSALDSVSMQAVIQS